MTTATRYKLSRDFYAGLHGDTNWAVYDLQSADTETPIAVFAKRGDALAFRKMKEGK